MVPVTGIVTMDGEPLEGASVTFMALSGTAGLGGTGVTDASGKYELAHFRAGSGVEPGEYKVTINKLVLSDGSPIPPGTTSAADLNTKDLVPFRYSDYGDTTLKAAVKPGGEPIDFALTSR